MTKNWYNLLPDYLLQLKILPIKTSLQSKTDAIAVMKLLKTMTFRKVLIRKDNNDFHDILVTLVTK